MRKVSAISCSGEGRRGLQGGCDRGRKGGLFFHSVKTSLCHMNKAEEAELLPLPSVLSAREPPHQSSCALLHPSVLTTRSLTRRTPSEPNSRSPTSREVLPSKRAAAQQAPGLGGGQGPRLCRGLQVFKNNKTGPNPLPVGLEQWLSALELKI